MPSLSSVPARPSGRIPTIDILRGLVIVLMLLDHVRETFFLHHQVSDPMDIAQTPPDLFYSRLLAHLCAPVFIFLTGLSAWLYADRQGSMRAASGFLFKRGLLLVALEVTIINFAWTFIFPPTVIYLQVIWAIGCSMLALAALVWLPRPLLTTLGLLLVFGHNLLDGFHFGPDTFMHIPWAILHDRGWLEFGDALRLRTSYPILPWIGVIALGFAAGPWFGRAMLPATRQSRLLYCGLGALLLFVLLRLSNAYGQAQPWQTGNTLAQDLMSFVNITKYPPSLLFLLLTLGLGLLLLRALERHPGHRWQAVLQTFGSAPMFFYILHLYALKLLYLAAVGLWGLNQGEYYGFEHLWAVWVVTLGLAAALYPAVRWFGQLKRRRPDIVWLKYF